MVQVLSSNKGRRLHAQRGAQPQSFGVTNSSSIVAFVTVLVRDGTSQYELGPVLEVRGTLGEILAASTRDLELGLQTQLASRPETSLRCRAEHIALVWLREGKSPAMFEHEELYKKLVRAFSVDVLCRPNVWRSCPIWPEPVMAERVTPGLRMHAHTHIPWEGVHVEHKRKLKTLREALDSNDAAESALAQQVVLRFQRHDRRLRQRQLRAFLCSTLRSTPNPAPPSWLPPELLGMIADKVMHDN